ncbi:MAG: GntR family transcriptional regulator [Planctomycetes bacterium]|nr:GntR family transcriptional regulator [Planctomycetota bacterium]
MDSTVDRSSGEPAFLQLKQRLREAILSGALGNRLPSERELARQHGIAYMTARRAVDALVADRLVHRVPGVGTFVSRSDTRRARADNLGIVLAAGIRYGLANPFYGPVVVGALAAAREAGMSVFVCTTGDELLPRRDDHDSRRKVDGLVSFGRADAAGRAALAAAAQFVPVVALNDEPVAAGMAALRSDDHGGGRLAADHLLARGRRRIAWIGARDAMSSDDRFAGFRAALAEAGFPLAGLLTRLGDYEVESGEAIGRELLALAEPPDAIACANDAMACGVMRAAHQAQVAVPARLAVLGFDDLLLDRYLPQPLTSIGIDAEGAGRLAASTLLAQLAGHAVAAAQALPFRLNVRATT